MRGAKVDTMEGEDGYELWLRYRKVSDPERLAQYRRAISSVRVLGESSTAEVIRSELARALPALLDMPTPVSDRAIGNALVAGLVDEIRGTGLDISPADRHNLGDEGFLIRSYQDGSRRGLFIAGNAGPAVLTGTFHLLRLLQTHEDISALDITSRPLIRRRILTHWDNLDGSIERGYAGRSLWHWDDLPAKIDPRYRDYGRACASIGINGACLTNVNAGARSLAAEYLEKTAALADVLRPYGVRIYLSPDFSAPIRLGELGTSDPRDPVVAAWWRRKSGEIYRLIPDFGGFQVKANSEGRSGPQDYSANHDDGANMLADVLAPHGGVVLWRAFVYDVNVDADRAKCAYKEFAPLDGRFRPNVFVQAKNGPIDFQPREPFHPLFTAMRETPLALEVQITQEYLGQSVHLVYLGCMWKEVLDAGTYVQSGGRGRLGVVGGGHVGPPQQDHPNRTVPTEPSQQDPPSRTSPTEPPLCGSSVARIVDGSLYGHGDSCIIGVANTGSDRNWCGHHFAQANWYAFGRLAWDHRLKADAIAREWIRMTWSGGGSPTDLARQPTGTASNGPSLVHAIEEMMLGSWEACINYMTPLGLHHLMREGHHYGPDPVFNVAPRVDWNNVYFHRADVEGLGFDRSRRGSNAVGQYLEPLAGQFDDMDACPEELLLWFHHVPWEHTMRSGRTLWQELQHRYDVGVAFVERMCDIWQGLEGQVDPQRHEHVSQRLEQQLENAREWRKTCIDYFGQFARGMW